MIPIGFDDAQWHAAGKGLRRLLARCRPSDELRRRPGRAWRRGTSTFALVAGLGALGLLAADRQWPLPLPANEGYAQVVTDKDGRPLRSFADANGVWRYPITPEAVSPHYLKALLTYEDRWFYRHPGVNPLALARAAWQNLRHGRLVSGGSTLTMQVARIIDPHARSFAGKARQILRALQLEYHLTKDEILTLYLNQAPFGGNLAGVQAASYTYFGRGAGELSLAEAALLAVMPQAPSRLRPDRHPEQAQQARDKLLARLVALGVARPDEVEAARQEPVSARVYAQPRLAPLLALRLRREALADQRQQGSSREPGTGAGAVQSTIDFGLQQALEDYVADYVDRLPSGTSAAVLVVENATLAARAYLGSSHWGSRRRFGYIDMTAAVRSPGSTLKPFVYGLALDLGLIHSHSLLSDAPRFWADYRPTNFGDAFAGPVSAASALQRSLNVPAVQLLEAVGPGRFAGLLEQGGVQPILPGGKPGLPMILGGVGVRMIELTGLYTALANDGLAGRVRLTEAEPPRQRRVLSPGAAWILRSMLLENPSPERLRGERWVRGPVELAWKTGTSYGFRDAWSFGVGPRYTIGVWIGRPDGTPMPGHYGLVTAAPLLFAIAHRLTRDGGRFSPRPDTVSEAEICWPLGRALADTPPAWCEERHTAWLLDDQTPPTLRDGDGRDYSSNPLALLVDAETGLRLHPGCLGRPYRRERIALWPTSVEPWLPSARRRRHRIPPLHPDCAPEPILDSAALQIVGLTDGQIIRPAGGRNASPPSVRLHSLGGDGRRFWLLDGRFLLESGAGRGPVHTFAESGRHRLSVWDETGRSDSVELFVHVE